MKVNRWLVIRLVLIGGGLFAALLVDELPLSKISQGWSVGTRSAVVVAHFLVPFVSLLFFAWIHPDYERGRNLDRPSFHSRIRPLGDPIPMFHLVAFCVIGTAAGLAAAGVFRDGQTLFGAFCAAAAGAGLWLAVKIVVKVYYRGPQLASSTALKPRERGQKCSTGNPDLRLCFRSKKAA